MSQSNLNSVVPLTIPPVDETSGPSSEPTDSVGTPLPVHPRINLRYGDQILVLIHPLNTKMISSVSTTSPGAHNSNSNQTDLIIFDNIWFYVNANQLLNYSSNNLDSLLPPKINSTSDKIGPMVVPESSVVINVLHTLYDISCAQYTPDFDTLSKATASMQKYGVRSKDRIAPSTPLFTLLISHAPVNPLPLYILAAKHRPSSVRILLLAFDRTLVPHR